MKEYEYKGTTQIHHYGERKMPKKPEDPLGTLAVIFWAIVILFLLAKCSGAG